VLVLGARVLGARVLGARVLRNVTRAIIKTTLWWGVFLCVDLAAGGGRLGARSSLNANAQPPPDGPGKSVFESVCNLCHDGPMAVMGKQWTRTQWDAKVTEMLQEEPDISPEDIAVIVEYLSSNFKPGGKIYINRATAKDLETALELSTRDAEAIARYREEQGSFKTLDDLKRVPGLEAAKIEAKKDRLAF
jgi:competence protein ComEA